MKVTNAADEEKEVEDADFFSRRIDFDRKSTTSQCSKMAIQEKNSIIPIQWDLEGSVDAGASFVLDHGASTIEILIWN
jgi:hypothetical protein